jgi:hypothetical protein
MPAPISETVPLGPASATARQGRSKIRPGLLLQAVVASTILAGVLTILCAAYGASEKGSKGLASPENFSSIFGVNQRSAALFAELGKVLTHPRCVNCHPAGDRPRQGNFGRLHQPPVVRGADGFGLPAMRCPICHQRANFEPARMPGRPQWHLAPREMGWEGKTLGEICAQLKDPERNGGRGLDDLVHHIGRDTLVGWAWAPGFGREPAPGTQQQAGALAEAWVETGAACP